MKTAARIHPVMHIPPPLLFALTFFAGVGLQRLAPLTVRSAAVVDAGRIIGFASVGCGALLALTCLAIFLAARTTLVPFGTAASLVTRGPYRITRNPMYVSLVLVYVGVAGLLAQTWPLLLLPVPVAVMHAMVVPFEEARMREAFGDAFEQYCSRVRRWL